MSKPKLPEDLGIVLGTEEQQFWTDIKKKAESAIFNNKHEIVINQQILELAVAKIEEETQNSDK